MVEFAGRRKLTNVSNSSSVVYDVERAEGVVQQEGTAFSAANMNDLETRIANAITATDETVTELNKNMGGLVFAQDAGGNWGYKVGGADTVHPFSITELTLIAEKSSGNQTNNIDDTLTMEKSGRVLIVTFVGSGTLGVEPASTVYHNGAEIQPKHFYNGGGRYLKIYVLTVKTDDTIRLVQSSSGGWSDDIYTLFYV